MTDLFDKQALINEGLLYTNEQPVIISYSWADDIKEISLQLKRIADALERDLSEHMMEENDET